MMCNLFQKTRQLFPTEADLGLALGYAVWPLQDRRGVVRADLGAVIYLLGEVICHFREVIWHLGEVIFRPSCGERKGTSL